MAALARIVQTLWQFLARQSSSSPPPLPLPSSAKLSDTPSRLVPFFAWQSDFRCNRLTGLKSNPNALSAHLRQWWRYKSLENYRSLVARSLGYSLPILCRVRHASTLWHAVFRFVWQSLATLVQSVSTLPTTPTIGGWLMPNHTRPPLFATIGCDWHRFFVQVRLRQAVNFYHAVVGGLA